MPQLRAWNLWKGSVLLLPTCTLEVPCLQPSSSTLKYLCTFFFSLKDGFPYTHEQGWAVGHNGHWTYIFHFGPYDILKTWNFFTYKRQILAVKKISFQMFLKFSVKISIKLHSYLWKGSLLRLSTHRSPSSAALIIYSKNICVHFFLKDGFSRCSRHRRRWRRPRRRRRWWWWWCRREKAATFTHSAGKSIQVTITSSLVRIPLVFQNSVKRRTRQHLPGDGDFRHTPRVWSPSVAQFTAQFAIASGDASHGPNTIGSTCSGQLPLWLFIYTFSNGVKGQLICIARAFFA